MLSHYAGVLARDHSLNVAMATPGSGSRANLSTKEIKLDPRDCSTPATARFVAAHEGAHIGETPSLTALGKTPEQCRDYSRKIGFHSFHNVTEDGAINDILSLKFAALASDTLESYERVDPAGDIGCINTPEVVRVAYIMGRPPRFAQALAGILNDWSELRHELGFGRPLAEYQSKPRLGGQCDDPDVNRFFERTLNEVRAAMSIIPEVGSDANASFLCGARRFMRCETLYPELKTLVDLDLKDIATALEQALQNSEGLDNVDASPDELARQALEMLAAADDSIRKILESLKEAAESESPSTGGTIKADNDAARLAEDAAKEAERLEADHAASKENLDKAQTPYNRERQVIANALDDAHARLVDVFEPQRHFTWKMGMPSGSRAHLNSAMQFELTGKGYNSMWMNRIDPKYPSLDVVIILDRSGSMDSDEKYVHARRALIMARELFELLSIPTACVGFAEKAELFVGFDDTITHMDVQENIMTHSIPLNEGTNDCSAIEYAASILKERKAARRAIIMISDAGSSQASELKAAVERLAAENIPVLHFGLGTGTTDTSNNYIESWGDLSLSGSDENGFLAVFCREMERLAEDAL